MNSFKECLVCKNIFYKPKKKSLSDFVKRKTCSNPCRLKRLDVIRSGTKFSIGHKKSLKHGMSYTHFYHVWKNMKKRCMDPRDKFFHRYGGRGISVCEKWLTIDGFKEDLYESYCNRVNMVGRKNTTIDRIDNNKGYFKENCRWTDMKQQARNK